MSVLSGLGVRLRESLRYLGERVRNLRVVIIFAMSFVSLIAMFFVFLLTFDKMRSIVADAAITNTEQVVGQTTTTLDNYVDNMLSISSGISTNIFRYTPDEMQAYLNTSQMLSPDIVSITLFDELGEVYKYSPQSIDIKQNITLGSQQWYDETEAETAEDIRFSTPHVQNLFQNYYPWVITNYYSTAVKWDNKIKYTVAIDMSFATIDEYCRNINIGQRGYVFVMGPDGRIIYHPQQQMLNAGMRAEEDWGFIKDKENGAYFYNEDIVMVISTLKNNWKLIGISYMQETRETMNEIIRYMAFAYVAVFFLILLFAAAIARYVSKPVNRIIKAMEIAQDNQFTTYVWEDGFVEVRRLSASYNNMTSRIRELMEQIRREQRELRKTEIRALQAQINPHFLYNTLDSILWMCEKGDNKGAVTMVSSLGKLFRISLSKGREMITVREEVAHAENYLQIQGVRYKDQFSYKIEAEERLLDYKTPKIVLQPFLENAIYHAFGHSSEKGVINIRVLEREGRLIMEIEDNGVGISKERIGEIERGEVGSESGIGIRNVSSRIQIYFGQDYGVSIQSVPDEGTLIRITLPTEITGEDILE